jgi:FdhD protein
LYKTIENINDAAFVIEDTELYSLPSLLRNNQSIFESTGGIHAVGLFRHGKLLYVREDIGRHNAMDKIIGAAAKDKLLPLRDSIVLLSGRASYELIDKCAVAGVSIVAAVGAPSSLAIRTAEKYGITLAGFVRSDRFNIYSHPNRIHYSFQKISA